MMTSRLAIGTWVCLLLGLGLGGCNQEGREAITQAHADWNQAFLDRDGEAFYEMLALPAQDYYNRILGYSLHATRRQVLDSPPVERYQILLARQKLTRKEMEELDGRSFVILTINDGWFDPDDFWEETIRKIKFSGSSYASAELVADGIPQEARYGFVYEDGIWKVDDTLVDPVWDQFYREQAAYYEVTVNKLLIGWVEEDSGEAVPDSIWDGPR